MRNYDLTYDPPAAVLDVTVTNPFVTGRPNVGGRGKLDSGADMSVIPNSWATRIGLLPLRLQRAVGYDGKEEKKPVCIVEIAFNGHCFQLEVIMSQRDSVLIGRDILNKMRVALDGPNLQFEIV